MLQPDSVSFSGAGACSLMKCVNKLLFLSRSTCHMDANSLVAGDNNVGVGPFGTGSSGNAVVGGAGGDGGDNNGNTANGGRGNSGDFSGNGGIAAGNNGNGGNGGTAIGGESTFVLCAVCTLF